MHQVATYGMRLYRYRTKNHQNPRTASRSTHRGRRRFVSLADQQTETASSSCNFSGYARARHESYVSNKRLHYSQRQEFRVLAGFSELTYQLPPGVQGGNRMIKAQDFDDRVDVSC